jgi:tripartite-type tricarboxylate transporter receptor subunit TctC
MVQPIARHLSPLRLLLLALAGLAMMSPLAAQPFPSGMIRIVNGNAPGTPPDIVSRVVANDLSESEELLAKVGDGVKG